MAEDSTHSTSQHFNVAFVFLLMSVCLSDSPSLGVLADVGVFVRPETCCSISGQTAQALVFLLVSVCLSVSPSQPKPWCSCWCRCVYHHTAQTQAFVFLVSVCCDAGQALVFLLVSVCCDAGQALVFLLVLVCSCWC